MIRRLLLIAVSLSFLLYGYSFAEGEGIVTVYFDKALGPVNKQVFGNNLLGFDPALHRKERKTHYYGHADYGAGIWDARKGRPITDVVNFAKEAGITVVRFPGGCGAHFYNWRGAVGEKREHFLYGIDEFLTTAKEIGAEPLMTVSFLTGDERDAADLVKYTKGRIRYFEIGNEVWHGNHRDIRSVSPSEYAAKYLKYYEAMKAASEEVKIGVLLHNQTDEGVWNEKVLGAVKDKLDFAVTHIYPTPAWRGKLSKISLEEIFGVTLALPEPEKQSYIQKLLRLLKRHAGKDAPLAITEFNAGFVQDEPVPYRHSLGGALVNAELLKIFMRPENNILMANYWEFVNAYWGMIANGFDGDYRNLYNAYYKRPNYYVFEFYHKHFGEILLETHVSGSGYNLKDYADSPGRKHFRKDIKALVKQDFFVPHLSVNASKSKDGAKVYLMIINKNLEESVPAAIVLKDFIPDSQGRAWTLNGPAVDATNEKKHDNVGIHRKKFKIKENSFEFTFEPHSLTAIEIGAE